MAYNPSVAPEFRDFTELRDFLTLELAAIQAAFQETTALDLRPVFVEPLRPREGMIVFADGTRWNPGAGKGAYEYNAGAWVKL
jgi:hypothetical protein